MIEFDKKEKYCITIYLLEEIDLRVPIKPFVSNFA